MPTVDRAPAPASGSHPPVDIMIEARCLTKRYGSTVAVDDVSFAVERGELFGILGPNGAGKSTTLEILETLRIPDSGSAHICGFEVQRHRAAVRARIGVQLQSTTLFPELTVADNLRLLACAYDHALPVKQVLSDVALLDRASSQLGTLSGGQQQRVTLAAALINNPSVLFLDEPTTGLDPQARRALWALLKELRARGVTIVLTTHYMEEAEELCDRIAIMDCARIVAIDTPAGLIASYGGGHTLTCTLGRTVDVRLLARLPDVTQVVPSDSERTFSMRVSHIETALLGLLQFAERESLSLSDLRVHQPGLEDVFLVLTGHTLRD